MKTENDLKTFFEPRGVAIVGARRSPGFGHGTPQLLQDRGWKDRLFLVNPKGGEIDGMEVYLNISDLPESVDLGIVIIPAPFVPNALVELGEMGIRHIVIESAGFGEAGSKGKALQEEIIRIREKYNLRIIGPNCIGLINNVNGFCTTLILPEAFPLGNTSIIAQSGVFGNILLDKMYLLEQYVSKAITLGNRIDVNECEMLEYLHHDPETKLIVLYLEGAANGRLLADTLSQVTPDKPVLVLKSGRTEQGRAATASHTGSMSGVDSLYQGMFNQTGAIRAETLDELMILSRVFATQPLPKGNRLGVVTGSGSMGALATDAAVSEGLELPTPTDDTIRQVKEKAPEWMNVKNPLDVGPSGQFVTALTALVQDADIDMVLGIITFPHSVFRKYTAEGLTSILAFGDLPAIRKLAPEKPFLICVVGHDDIASAVVANAGSQTPVLTSPEMAAKSLATLWRYQQWKNDNK
ncbi:MAG: hypothetical protein GY866_36990 [Proteobacteria bacterium]|nr:hypothetical protein [Pseudomonadota bacterium]